MKCSLILSKTFLPPNCVKRALNLVGHCYNVRRYQGNFYDFVYNFSKKVFSEFFKGLPRIGASKVREMEAASPVSNRSVNSVQNLQECPSNLQNKIYVVKSENELQTISSQQNEEIDPLSLSFEKNDLFTVTDEDSGKESIQYTSNFHNSYG